MVTTSGLQGAARSAIGGISSAQAMADRAAATVASSGAQANQFGNAASVQISTGARAMAEATDHTVGDVASAMVDLNMAETLERANVRVLQTTNDMERELSDLVKAKPDR